MAINCAAIPETLLESELLATRKVLSPMRAPRSAGSSNWPIKPRCRSLDEIQNFPHCLGFGNYLTLGRLPIFGDVFDGGNYAFQVPLVVEQ